MVFYINEIAQSLEDNGLTWGLYTDDADIAEDQTFPWVLLTLEGQNSSVAGDNDLFSHTRTYKLRLFYSNDTITVSKVEDDKNELESALQKAKLPFSFTQDFDPEQNVYDRSYIIEVRKYK